MGNPWVEEFRNKYHVSICFLSLSPPASELAIIDVTHIINIYLLQHIKYITFLGFSAASLSESGYFGTPSTPALSFTAP